MWRVWAQEKGLHKKRVDADQTGGKSAFVQTPSVDVKPKCCVCGKEDGIKCCSNCESTKYCSSECQKSHWSYHKVYCKAISKLVEVEKDKVYQGKTVRQAQLNERTKRKLVKLIGDKPRFRCYLGDKCTDMLWDTGSMVSMVDRSWLDNHFPGVEVLPVSSVLEGKELDLTAANQSKIAYDGVVLMDFGLRKGEKRLIIPILVSTEPIAEPILGYNVIEELLLES